jgi:hypothetical protein
MHNSRLSASQSYYFIILSGIAQSGSDRTSTGFGRLRGGTIHSALKYITTAHPLNCSYSHLTTPHSVPGRTRGPILGGPYPQLRRPGYASHHIPSPHLKTRRFPTPPVVLHSSQAHSGDPPSAMQGPVTNPTFLRP